MMGKAEYFCPVGEKTRKSRICGVVLWIIILSAVQNPVCAGELGGFTVDVGGEEGISDESGRTVGLYGWSHAELALQDGSFYIGGTEKDAVITDVTVVPSPIPTLLPPSVPTQEPSSVTPESVSASVPVYFYREEDSENHLLKIHLLTVGTVQILSFRIDGAERQWEWQDDCVVTSVKKEEFLSKVELILVSEGRQLVRKVL